VLFLQLVEGRLHRGAGNHRLGLEPILPQERGARNLHRRNQCAGGGHRGGGHVEHAVAQLLHHLGFLAELLAREDLDRHLAIRAFGNPRDELVIEFARHFADDIGMAEPQHGLGLRAGRQQQRRRGHTGVERFFQDHLPLPDRKNCSLGPLGRTPSIRPVLVDPMQRVPENY
jgi:hypothetical protein